MISLPAAPIVSALAASNMHFDAAMALEDEDLATASP
jgi:hypothetical protein